MFNEVQTKPFTLSRAITYGLIFLVSYEIYFILSNVYLISGILDAPGIEKRLPQKKVLSTLSHVMKGVATFQVAGFVGASVWFVLQRVLERYQTLKNTPALWLCFIIVLAGLPLFALFQLVVVGTLMPFLLSNYTGVFDLVGYAYVLLLGFVLFASQSILVFRCVKSLFISRKHKAP